MDKERFKERQNYKKTVHENKYFLKTSMFLQMMIMMTMMIIKITPMIISEYRCGLRFPSPCRR
jgi:hypothetical protein